MQTSWWYRSGENTDHPISHLTSTEYLGNVPQLPVWMLSHTRTTSGYSLRTSTSVEAASICSSSRAICVRGTNSVPAKTMLVPRSFSDACTFLRAVVSQSNCRVKNRSNLSWTGIDSIFIFTETERKLIFCFHFLKSNTFKKNEDILF